MQSLHDFMKVGRPNVDPDCRHCHKSWDVLAALQMAELIATPLSAPELACCIVHKTLIMCRIIPASQASRS